MEGDEHQITRGIGHCNEIASKLAYEVFTAAIEIGAVSSLLQERGLLTQEELKEQRISEGKRLMGISVYAPGGGPPGWGRAALRTLVGTLPFLWPVDAVLLGVAARRQRLCDSLTGCTIRRVAH